MSKNLRASGIIMFAFLGAASILYVLISIATFLTRQSIQASDLLPSKETLVYMHKPTTKQIDAYREIFPELSTIQFEVDIEALALTSSGYALFIRRSMKENEPNISIPPFTITVSNPEVKKLLEPKQGNLSTFPTFQKIQRNQNQEQDWIYIQKNALPHSWGFLKNTSIESLSKSKKDTVQFISFAKNEKVHTPTISKQISVLLAHPFFVTSSDNAPLYWKQINSLIPKESADISDAILQKVIIDMFGDAIDWEYDVAPLLHGHSVIEIEYTASGNLLYAIHGTSPPDVDVDHSLQKISDSFSQKFPDAIEIRSRTLDNRFNAKDIRKNEHTSKEEFERIQGWNVIQYSETSKRPTLLIAKRNREFIISNAKYVIDALNTTKSMLLPATKNIQQSAIHIGGFINTKNMQILLQNQVPELWNILSIVGKGIQEHRFSWSLGTREDVQLMLIHHQEEGEFPWQTQDPTVQ